MSEKSEQKSTTNLALSLNKNRFQYETAVSGTSVHRLLPEDLRLINISLLTDHPIIRSCNSLWSNKLLQRPKQSTVPNLSEML